MSRSIIAIDVGFKTGWNRGGKRYVEEHGGNEAVNSNLSDPEITGTRTSIKAIRCLSSRSSRHHGLDSRWLHGALQSLRRIENRMETRGSDHRLYFSFAIYKTLMTVFPFIFKTEMTLLENNCMQSTASSAGYSTGTMMCSGISAYLMVTGHHIPVGILAGGRSSSLLSACSWRFR